MKPRIAVILTGVAALATVARADITDVIFSAFDPAGQNTPFYNTFYVVSDPTVPAFGQDFTQPVAGVQLLDAGWQNPYVQYISQGVPGSPNSSTLRSIGWNQYEFKFNSVTDTESIYMNGSLVVSAPYTGSLTYFALSYHNLSGTNASQIQNLSVTFNGQTEFQDNFNSTILNPLWIIERLDAGTFISSGGGQLSIGNVGSGNVAATVALDLQAIPEPSTYAAILGTAALGFAVIRRRRVA